MDKNKEYYLAIAFAMGFVWMQNDGKSRLARSAIAGISGGMGYSLSGEVSDYFGRGEIFTAFVLTAFGYLVFDTLGALLADRQSIKEIIAKRLGGSK